MELYYAWPPSVTANPRLQPEIFQNFEFVAEQYYGDHLRLTGDLFQNRSRNLIHDVTIPDGSIQFQNAGSVISRGLETEVEGKWSSLNARLSYTFQISHQASSSGPLVDSPRHAANFNLTAPLIRGKLFTGLDVHYYSSRLTLGGNKTAGFVLPDLTLLTAHVARGLELSATVYNLFDTRYGYPGGNEHTEDILYQDGRSFRLKLTYTFPERRVLRK
jgi:iron complex outermembrane receptor protein